MYRVRQQDSVRAVTPSDAPAWLRLRRALWPHHAESEHAAEITEFLEGRARARWPGRNRAAQP